MPIIRLKLKPDSVVYTDSFRFYNTLDVSEFDQSLRTLCRQEKPYQWSLDESFLSVLERM